MKVRSPGRKSLVVCALAALVGFQPSAAFPQSFTIRQILSAPFPTDLIAAPAGGRLAWVQNIEGRRNIWVAEPDAAGKGYLARQLTNYTQDDGQSLGELQWTPDGRSILYVRGEPAGGSAHTVPNPALFPLGAKQEIYQVRLEDGKPQQIAEGNSPAIAPDGKTLAFLAMGQVWTVSLDTAGAKPERAVVQRGMVRDLRWSPDSSRLAFVSFRGDHSFIVVYTVAGKSLSYLEPSTNVDGSFAWSPDSRRVAILRVPAFGQGMWFKADRAGHPWSIRVADVVTGKGREVWRAAEGEGSVYHPSEARDQLYWVAGDRLVFPWERDGWQHFYSVPVAGGSATLLTPGDFEIQHATLSFDRRTLVFDSNQGDLDRRHVWKVHFAGDGSAGLPQAVTSGAGIETQPVVISDNTSIAVLRSDAHFPLRPAMVEAAHLVDLAPGIMPADFPGARLVEPKEVIFPAADGLPIHAQLFLPPETRKGEHHPAAVFFHGGSRRQMLLGWHWIEYYSNTYAMNQYLASKGYVVLSVNYRGGIGYGLNFREALNYGPSGASEFNDVLGAALYLRGRGDVDSSRIACWGGSYGGYLTALSLARASDLFAAGVDYAGVYDWNLILPESSFDSDPERRQKERQIAYLASPSASISQWRSPILLIQGDDDRNVKFSETVQNAEALREHHVEFEELIVPDGMHGILRWHTWIESLQAQDDFLDRKLKLGRKQ